MQASSAPVLADLRTLTVNIILVRWVVRKTVSAE